MEIINLFSDRSLSPVTMATVSRDCVAHLFPKIFDHLDTMELKEWLLLSGLLVLGSCYFALAYPEADDELLYQNNFHEPDWYTPSRKAHLYSRKVPSSQLTAGARQGEALRLPGDIIPISYNIRLLPFIGGNFSTDGYVEILVQCVRNAPNISLNSADIDINVASISVT